ncbi:argonaute 2-like 2, partial [Homarus americanus]
KAHARTQQETHVGTNLNNRWRDSLVLLVLVFYIGLLRDVESHHEVASLGRRAVFEDLKKTYPQVFQNFRVAFDSEKNAYSVNAIPQTKKKGGIEYEVNFKEEGDRTTKFFVTLTKVNEGYLKDLFVAIRKPPEKREDVPQFIFQMIEVMFQHNPSLRYQRVGRNCFYPMGGEFGPSFDIGGGKEALMGFFGSLRPAAWKDGCILLNIDVAHTAFYKDQSVLEYMKEALNFQPHDFNSTLRPDKQRKLAKELRNMRVQVTHSQNKRTYKVTDVGVLGADRQTFPLDTGGGKIKQCTVEKYFLDCYRKKLTYPRLNCLKVGPVQRNIYIPIECCRIAKGQKVPKKLSDSETSQFIRNTAKIPSERLHKIQDIVNQQNLSNDPMMRALEFNISDRPVILDGRVLPAPKIQMNEEFLPYQGVWDARNRNFYLSAKLGCWAVVNYDAGYVKKDFLLEFLGSLRRMGRERGMTIEEPVEIREVRDFYAVNPEVDFANIKKKFPTIEMIMVVLPKSKDVYGRVKKVGDRVLGVITQCIQGLNVRKNQAPTVGNILLKINAKMGGTNNVLGVNSRPIVFSNPVMIMGADVNHPQASDISTPSLAAVVATTDKFASKYAVEVRHQKHRTEMIQDLKEMTKNLLISFYKSTKRKPDRIIMFRDGVSESQFLEVLSYELKAMRAACTELEEGYTPAMTFIVVQKRHHTRLFCQDRDGVGRSKNIPPGTTVDTFITHPTERDFYLCSHQGIQGTSKPTHYHILWDDSDLTMNDLQTLTYAMCHLYSRCTRSVSIPTPAYYAHLVAFRAKVHSHDLCHSETSSSASSGEEGPSDAVMAEATRMDRQKLISSKLYYV